MSTPTEAMSPIQLSRFMGRLLVLVGAPKASACRDEREHEREKPERSSDVERVCHVTASGAIERYPEGHKGRTRISGGYIRVLQGFGMRELGKGERGMGDGG